MALVWAWGRIPSRHGPAKKPAGQRKQGEGRQTGEAGGKAKIYGVSSEQQAMLRARIVGSSKRE
ncbi:BQ5605_C045g12219 [Microbotryum silenes-dioicae]|uniref:BQ5605_C045g12219 protein n=1 Tax=Microbotryum silenes-dioicae TaxID=796604 RepID=A0A2X0MQA4_9BASI|nr:BQ5605_C045g12219 [Microbotryum silenes-dioicae]